MEKILVVDDKEDIRTGLENLLSEEGYSVCTAANYDEAMARMDETDFDLVFSDLFLGDRNGLDVLQEAKSGNSHRPVIVITGDQGAETMSRAFCLGALNYLLKPVRHATITNAARMGLQQKSSRE